MAHYLPGMIAKFIFLIEGKSDQDRLAQLLKGDPIPVVYESVHFCLHYRLIERPEEKQWRFEMTGRHERAFPLQEASIFLHSLLQWVDPIKTSGFVFNLLQDASRLFLRWRPLIVESEYQCFEALKQQEMLLKRWAEFGENR